MVTKEGAYTIWVAGERYRIQGRTESKIEGGLSVREELGCDGTDIFRLSDEPTPFNRDGKGITAFAYPGRVPNYDFVSSILKLAWLGYCSEGYFLNPSNRIGFPITRAEVFIPEHLRLEVEYIPGRQLPARLLAISDQWLKTGPQPVQYYWYTNGIKCAEFIASDFVTVAGLTWPRRLRLTTYFPLADTNRELAPEQVEPFGLTEFVAERIEADPAPFNPLPEAPAEGITLIDERFKQLTGNVLLTHKVYSNAWPTRGRPEIQVLEAKAKDIALQRGLVEEQRQKRGGLALAIIAGANLLLLTGLVVLVLRARRKNTQ